MTRRKDLTTDIPAEAEPSPAGSSVVVGATDLPEVTGPKASDQQPADATQGSTASTEAVTATPERDTPAVASMPRRSGVLAPLLGGALAALGGFGLSHFNVFGLSAPDQGAAVAALEQRLEDLAAQADQAPAILGLQQALDVLVARVQAIEDAPVPVVDLSRLDGIEQRLEVIETLPAGLDASTTALAAQLAETERKVAALSASGVDPGAVDAALARLAVVEADAKARADEAAALAEAAERNRNLEALAAAIASGSGFAAELAALSDPGLQAALTPHVAGVVTFAQLQADFPEAARAALQLDRAVDTNAGWGTRLLDFLGAQTGARSLTPRAGDGTDAILSRAEFALGETRLADALAELMALDAAIRAPLDGWIAAAEARLAVDAALAEAK